MLSEKEVIRVIQIVQTSSNYLLYSEVIRVAVQILEDCLDLGEFDGTFNSAVRCLTEQGFEIEGFV